MRFQTLDEVVSFWADEPETHRAIFTEFFTLVNNDSELKSMRDYIEMNDQGYGDRPFFWMWNLICQSLPQDFKFLEIGVYQGQIISLMSLLNKRFQKNGSIVGLTPLSNVDDEFSKHHDVDYEQRIATLYHAFDLDASDLTIIQGLSTDERSIRESIKAGPYDCLYIDGSHDLPVVTSDILIYGPQVKIGGLLVMDDACCDMKLPKNLIRMDWFGLEPVTRAVREQLHSDDNFQLILTVGHNKIFRKIS